MNHYFFNLISSKYFNRNLVFAVALKIIVGEVSTRVLNSAFERLLEKEILRAQSLNLSRRLGILIKLKNNMQALKMGLRCVVYGTLAPQNLTYVIESIINILKVFKREKANQFPLKDTGTDLKLPEIHINFVEKVQNPGVNIKVPADFKLNLKVKRHCEILKHYIYTQAELLKQFEKAELNKMSLKERITNYCTTEVNSMIKKLIANIRRQPVLEGLKTVKAQSEKVLRALDKLPQDSSKCIDLTNDLLFSMKFLDSYTKILQQNANMENIAYFKEHILPDLFVILTAIHKEAKK